MKHNSKMPLRNPPVERVTRERMKGGTTSWGGGGALRKHTVILPLSPPPEMSVFEAASDNVTSFSRP